MVSILESGNIPSLAFSELTFLTLFSVITGWALEKQIHQGLETSDPGSHKITKISLSLLGAGFDALTFLTLSNVLDSQTLQGITPVVAAGLLPGQITFLIRSLQREN